MGRALAYPTAVTPGISASLSAMAFSIRAAFSSFSTNA